MTHMDKFPSAVISYDAFKSINAQLKNKDDLSFMHINARSIPKNFDLLTLSLSNRNHIFSAIGISETWLNDENADSIDHFNHVYRCREDKVDGGVSLYINTHMEYKERHDIEKCFMTTSGESIFVKKRTMSSLDVFIGHQVEGCV